MDDSVFKNTFFNYQFRNTTCNYPVQCQFPEPVEKTEVTFIIIAVIVILAISFGIGAVIGVLVWLYDRRRERIEMMQTFY